MKKIESRESITIENEGDKIFAILHRPLVKHKVPAVVICSGFAGNKCGKHRIFVTLAQKLAEQGIAVLRFDYRGSGDSEGDFNTITLSNQVSDTLAMFEYLSSQPFIDFSRLGILGRSLGGAVAVLSASHLSSLKSLVLWAPVFTSEPWHSLWKAHQTATMDSLQEAMLQKLPAGIPNLLFLKEFFSLDLSKELKKQTNVSLLHIHGALDELVKIEQSEGYKNSRPLSSTSKFVVLPKGDHDFSDPEDQIVALKETVDWFVNTLLTE